MHFLTIANSLMLACSVSAAAVPSRRSPKQSSNLMIFANDAYVQAHKSEVTSTLISKLGLDTLESGISKRDEAPEAVSEADIASVAGDVSAYGGEHEKGGGYPNLNFDEILDVIRNIGPAGEDIAVIIEIKLQKIAKYLRYKGVGWIKDASHRQIAKAILEWAENNYWVSGRWSGMDVRGVKC
jgi:hypothetical protein